MRTLLSTFFFLLISFQIFSQSNDDKARLAYMNADEAFNKGDYKECVSKLNTAIGLLGKTNVKIQYLLIKSYFQLKDYGQAKAEMKKYFDLNPPKDEGYNEILLLFSKIIETATYGPPLNDARDGKTYFTVIIGTQTWMGENLAYKAGSGCWAYDKNESNVATYGYLYNWETSKNVCPSGWHLPSKAEFETLLSNAGGSGSNAYYALKESGSSGFSALLGGYFSPNNGFYDIGTDANWWSLSENDTDERWNLFIDPRNQRVLMSSNHKLIGFSVRCLKNK